MFDRPEDARVYLVRHGKAAKEGYARDEDRPLTKRGQRDSVRIAELIAAAGAPVQQIRHSGLVRARQTAEIFGERLSPPGGVIAVAGLTYVDPVEPLARELHLEPEPVMLVGHNPFMEELVSLMLTGSTGRMPVWFATSTVACLAYTGGAWSLRWVLSRELVKDDGKDD
jgi:phosphohistidine phosphatase